MIRFLLILALISLTGDDRRAGRRGNGHYQEERYKEAADAYREGLASLPDREPGVVPAGLMNNLGASLYRQGDYEGALTAFAGSSAMAGSPADEARGAYNAGNAAFRKNALEDALAQYRRALLRNPADENARFNYEFVKRKLEEQQKNQQQQDQPQQDQQQQDQQQQQEQQQEQEQQQQQEQQEQQEQQQRELKSPEELSRQEAERLLEAMENDEEQLLKQMQKMKARPRRVEKDW